MKFKTKVEALFALDKLKETKHSSECNLKVDAPLTEEFLKHAVPCNCGAIERNLLIEDLKKFITSKKV
jgi:hypothetical protein